MKNVYTTLILLIILTLTTLAQSGTAWVPVGAGLELTGTNAVVVNDKLYVMASGLKNDKNVVQFYRLDNGEWRLLSEFMGAGYRLGSYNGELYISGYLPTGKDSLGPLGIARWDGTAWRSIGEFVGNVYAMMEYQGELYIGGRIDSIAGQPLNCQLARWNGTRWAAASGTFISPKTLPRVTSLKIYNGELIVGGVFERVASGTDTVRSTSIVHWNGTRWAGLGPGVDREPALMEVYNDELYIFAPALKYAGPVMVQGLARWNGTRWDSVGTHGKWVNIRDMADYNGRLYAVGGGELWPGGMLAAGSVWDGTSWSDLPRLDTNIYVNFVKSYGGDLYIGGPFNRFGTTILHYVARLGILSSAGESLPADAGFIIYPNPASGSVHLQGKISSGSVIEVKDLFGRTLLRTASTGRDQQTIDLSALAAGAYIIGIPTEKGMMLRKVSIVR